MLQKPGATTGSHVEKVMPKLVVWGKLTFSFSLELTERISTLSQLVSASWSSVAPAAVFEAMQWIQAADMEQSGAHFSFKTGSWGGQLKRPGD